MKIRIKRKRDWFIAFVLAFLLVYAVVGEYTLMYQQLLLSISNFRLTRMNQPHSYGNLIVTFTIMSILSTGVLLVTRRQRYLAIPLLGGGLLVAATLGLYLLHCNLIVSVINTETPGSVYVYNRMTRYHHQELTPEQQQLLAGYCVSLEPETKETAGIMKQQLADSNVSHYEDTIEIELTYGKKYGQTFDYQILVADEIIYIRQGYGYNGKELIIVCKDNGLLAYLTELEAEMELAKAKNDPGRSGAVPKRTIVNTKAADEAFSYGVIDQDGNIIVPIQYNYIGELREGYKVIKTAGEESVEITLDFDGNPADFDPDTADWQSVKIGTGDFYRKYSADYITITICRTVDNAELLTFTSEGDFRVYEIADSAGNRRLVAETEEADRTWFVFYDADFLLSCDPEYADLAKREEHDGRIHISAFSQDYTATKAHDNPYNRAVYSIVDNGVNRYGLLDMDGRIVIPPTYRQLNNGMYVGYYENDLIAAQNDNRLTGYIDNDGNEMIPFQYSEGHPFYKGYAVVRFQGGDLGIIDKSGTEVYRTTTHAQDFAFGYSDYWISAGQWTEVNPLADTADWSAVKYDGTIIDLKKMLGEQILDQATYNFYTVNDWAIVAQRYWPDGKQQTGILNPETGEWIVALSAPETGSYISWGPDTAYFEYYVSNLGNDQVDSSKLYSRDGQELISGYDRLVTSVDGLFLVETGDKWCWYDETGTQLKEFNKPIF